MRGGEYMQMVAEAGDWLWGLVQGGFNEQQTVSQIVVDAAIGMIPLVGDVTAARDLLAVVIRLADQPAKREDPLQWVELVICLFALIPVAGGVVKGVGRLLMRVGSEAAQHPALLREIVQFLNRPGIGNATRYLRDLDLTRYIPDLKRHFNDVIGRLGRTIDAVLRRTRWVMPTAMRTRLTELKSSLNQLLAYVDSMIPRAVRDLNDRLKLIQRLIYQGEWDEIPSSLRSSTREAEAGLVQARRLPLPEELPHRPSTRGDYQHREGWPPLTQGDHVRGGRYSTIETFSGPVRATHVAPGEEIFRVVYNSEGRPFTRLGGCWFRGPPPRTAREWREKFAVLDDWNVDGEIIVMRVPANAPEGVRVWEGTVASQVQRDTSKRATYGQTLPGGATQIFIDFSGHNEQFVALAQHAPIYWTTPAGRAARQDPAKVLDGGPVNWQDDHMGIGIPPPEVRAQLIGEAERAEKVGDFNAVTRASNAGVRANRDNEQQPRP